MYFFKDKDCAMHILMHCLVGTFIKDLPCENAEEQGLKLYPVKIILPPNKSRILYLDSYEK